MANNNKRPGQRRTLSWSTITALLLVWTLSAGCSGASGDDGPGARPIETRTLPGSMAPHLSVTADDRVVMSWLQPADDGYSLQWSALGNERWTDAVEIARSDNWFINWADFPSVTPIDGQFWAAHWLAKKPGGVYAYDVAVSLSGDAGQTWGDAFIVHEDDSPTEHGFVTLYPWQDQLGVLWLDGRNTKPGQAHGHGDGDGHHHHAGGMTIRGARFDAQGRAIERSEIDELVCDCCQTDIAVTDEGPVAVYRDRSTGEIRDIHVARYRDGAWQPDKPVAYDGWEISGCPVNGPAISATGSDVAVAWFTAAKDDLRIRLARSADSGETFGPPLDVDDNRPIGRVDVEQLDTSTTLVSWLRDADEGHAELSVRIVRGDGTMGPIKRIAKLGSGRISGFPQMVKSGDTLVFAWTDSDSGSTTIRSAVLELDRLMQD